MKLYHYHYIILTLSLVLSLYINRVDAGILNNATNTYIVQEEIAEEEIPVELEEEVIEEEVIKEEVIELIEEELIEEEIEDEVKIEIKKFNIDGMILKEGKVSQEVLRVKKFFSAKGYKNISEDYVFDSKMKELVINYQLSNGIIADGIIGKITYQIINEHMELYNINIPEIILTITGEVPLGNWIIINKYNNTLYYLNGNNIINSYPVATGKSPIYTPEGKFTIVTKYINPSWGGAGIYKPVKGGAPNNPLGKRWMGLSIRGGGTYGIHGNSDKKSIGSYASLGCIRMFNEDVEYLFDLIDKGTPVWIGNDIKLKEFGLIF